MKETYTLFLAKEDFKFSSAHFTLFGPGTAELLHGHNYQVQVEIVGHELDEEGLLVGFAEVKAKIRELCTALDSRLLIPAECRHLEIREEEGHISVRFRDRLYRFPAKDTMLLPLINTSIELFARYLWQKLAPGLDGANLTFLGVNVSETAGQSCWYRAPLT